MLADPALLKRLIRFENYRRLLVNAKPGRKSVVRQRDFYTCQLEKLVQKSAEYGHEVQVRLNPNVYLNTFTNTDSPYRIPSSTQFTSREEYTEDSTARREEQGDDKAIRRFNPKSVDTPSPSNPNPELPTLEEGQSGETVQAAQEALYSLKDELKQGSTTPGAALVGIPANQYQKANGGQEDMAPRQAEPQQQAPRWIEEQPEPVRPARPEREVPLAVLEEGRQYARQYDDAHLIQSDTTRFKKLYATAEQALEGFHEGMYWERYDAAKDVAAKRARKCTNSKGFVTRVPYLFTCLENAFEFSLEEMVYLRGDDVLCADTSLFEVIDTMRDTYNRLANTEQIDVDYRTWLGDILDEYEKRKEPKERLNATARAYPVA